MKSGSSKSRERKSFTSKATKPEILLQGKEGKSQVEKPRFDRNFFVDQFKSAKKSTKY